MGFISNLLSAKNTYQANPIDISGSQSDYNPLIMSAGAGASQPNFDLAAASGSQGVAGQQAGLAAALSAAAQGQGPNVAQNQLAEATGQNLRTSASLLGSVKGMNPATAARQILANNAQVQQQAAGQSGTLAAQQQVAARGQLADALAAQRSGDQSDASLALGGQNAQTNLLGTVGGLQNSQNNTNVNQNLGISQINSGVAAGNTKATNDITGGLINAGATAAGIAAKGGGGGAAHGGKIPGKATVKGDSPANDTVPKMLSPGEVVIPRTIANKPEEAKQFVAALKKKKSASAGGSGAEGYGKVLEAHRHLNDRLRQLEALAYGGMVGR